jgi:hypothetical protein
MSYSLERCLQARFPGTSLEDDPQTGGRLVRRADRIYRIERNGIQVVFRVAPPALDGKSGPATKKKVVPRQRSTPKK